MAVVAVGVVAACARPAESGPGPVSAPPGNAVSGHVHGLGIDPGDGLAYVATHRGLVRLEPDGAAPVGDTRNDLMGFAVTGPGQYLASGHPGDLQEKSAGPASSLGLVRSTDGGRSWTEVSLAGAADLHAITVVGSIVYGWDSLTATVQASHDGGRTWEPRSRGSLADLAVDPTDPSHLWATTPEGIAESRDGGHTFTLVPPIPAMSDPLVFVETVPDLHGDREPDLVGVDTRGRVWGRYGDGWRVSGELGAAPTALAAVGPDRYLAATTEAVVSSEDAGRTWTTLAPVTP
ncbi:F510_1955 family glycosylhydrolase [Pseudonocardia pini]|uniref:F510_1955 family glycosylhydrolase n=1 Tax=Pseudonocardia pini TaxID=2758030 RepID=UPI0015F02295|nr:exo-alpha-sialidase [Pseudonocardia pini]